MSDPHPDNDLQAVEKALQSLAPDPGRLDRDRLMFDAGRLSAGTSKVWPWAALASSTLAAALAMIIVLRPAPEPIVQVVHVPVKVDETPMPEVTPIEPSPVAVAVERREPESSHGYARLQDHLIRFGLDLPALPPLPDGSPSADDDMRIRRGSSPTPGLFTSWLFSGGAN